MFSSMEYGLFTVAATGMPCVLCIGDLLFPRFEFPLAQRAQGLSGRAPAPRRRPRTAPGRFPCLCTRGRPWWRFSLRATSTSTSASSGRPERSRHGIGLLVQRTCLQCRKHVFLDELLPQIADVRLHGPGRMRLFLHPLQLLGCPEVAGGGDDLGIRMFSISHRTMTDVSSPPEYATTIRSLTHSAPSISLSLRNCSTCCVFVRRWTGNHQQRVVAGNGPDDVRVLLHIDVFPDRVGAPRKCVDHNQALVCLDGRPPRRRRWGGAHSGAGSRLERYTAAPARRRTRADAELLHVARKRRLRDPESRASELTPQLILGGDGLCA